MRNKLGKLFSIWWVAVMLIVTIGIVASTVVFYGSYGDVRRLEAQSLSDTLGSCIINGVIIDSNILSSCGINQAFFESNSKYFVMVTYEKAEFKFGNEAFEKDCKISSLLNAKNYPQCVEKEIIADGRKITILTGSNNFGRNNKL